MAQREERLAEIKRRVGLLEQGGGDNLQPLIEAEANMRDAHIRMKAVLGDLGKANSWIDFNTEFFSEV